MRVVYQRHFLEHQQTCFLWYWKQSNIIFQRKQHNLTDYLAVIPPISTFRENELSQYIENLRHEGLTSEELEQREGVCRRIESILRGGGLTGKLTFYIKFISMHSLSAPLSGMKMNKKFCLSYSISSNWSLSIPPENTRKPELFSCFQEL